MPRVEIFMRRATVLILLSASLLSAPASSLSQIWSLFASLWTAPDSIDTDRPVPTLDAGCILDPNGIPRCAPGS
jgi:hypothetical protein